MEISNGRSIYDQYEDIVRLRHSKRYHPYHLKALPGNASKFVSGFGKIMPHNNMQTDIQLNYHLHQQYQYKNQEQHIIPSSNDRLRNINNGIVTRGSDSYDYQKHRSGQQQEDYQQNNHYYYPWHQHHHDKHQQRYNNYHNQHQHQHQHQYHHQNQQHAIASAIKEIAKVQEYKTLDYLQTVIEVLNQNPMQFDIIATSFITVFDGMEQNHYVMANAMEIIFNESIKNPIFQHMGAKIYNIFYTLNPSADSLFIILLNNKLHFHPKEMHQFMKNQQEDKVRLTALFLAELYMHLRDDESRMQLIADNIVFSLKQLLSIKDNKENMRCICSILKLAGYDLSADCVEDMKKIIAKLNHINCQNPGKYPSVSSVISLQKNNWGRKSYIETFGAATYY